MLYSFSGTHILNADLVLILLLSMADIANLILLAIHRMVTMVQIAFIKVAEIVYFLHLLASENSYAN